MKKFLLYTFLGIALTSASCSNDDKENLYLQDTTLSGLTSSSISFGNEGGTETFSITCAAMPSATSDVDWLVINRTGSSNKIHTFSVTASANNVAEVRNGYITVTAGKNKETITVSQEAGIEPVEPTPDATYPSLGLKAMDIAKDIRIGWNIGNTLEVPGNETGWGNPKVNPNYVAGIKDAGFNAVRIPCAWDSYIIDENNTIDPSWLERVDEVVRMVLNQDMYAIVNIHWDGGWLENNIGSEARPDLLKKQGDIWTQIANRLRNYNEKLMFAGLNEPNASNQAATSALLKYEQAFIDAVRATGGNNSTRTLIFQGPTTDINTTANYFNVNPSDPTGEGYLMAEIHYYDPSDYTIMEKDGQWNPTVKFFWGKDYQLEGSNRNCTWGDEDNIITQFDKMKSKFVDNNIPVIVGEFGAYPEEHIKNLTEEDQAIINDNLDLVRNGRAYFYNCVVKYGKERGLIPFVWDTGELINRNNGEIKDGKQYIIDAIIDGADSVSYPY